MAAVARLTRIWRCNTISFASKFKLYKSFVTAVLLYGCETWTLLDDSERRIQAFEIKCPTKLLRMSYFEHKINDSVRSKINFFVGSLKPLLATVKRRNFYGSGMSQATTASPEPSFWACWRVGGRGNAGWTSSKSGHPCLCQNCSQWPPSEKTGRGSELNRPSCAPDDPIGQGNDLN